MDWTPKPKIVSETDRGRLLTPDSNQILVGTSENEILIYQEKKTEWQTKAKIDPL